MVNVAPGSAVEAISNTTVAYSLLAGEKYSTAPSLNVPPPKSLALSLILTGSGMPVILSVALFCPPRFVSVYVTLAALPGFPALSTVAETFGSLLMGRVTVKV